MAPRLLGILVAAALMGTAVTSPHVSGGAPRPAPRAEPAPVPRTVSAWLPYWDQEGAYQDALRHADQLHTVSPFWYQAVSAGRVDSHPGAGDKRVIDGLHRARIAVVPTVMETMKPGALAAIVTTPEHRATHIRTLLALAKSRDYDGLDLDYESIAATGDATYQQVRDGFSKLVDGLCDGLHALRKKCVITVFPKTATTGRIWDYTALGRATDRLRIMAYNLHWASGKPGPLASVAWYDEMLRHAVAEVPRDKIELTLPAYGWDWAADGTGGRAKHVTWREAEALRLRTKAAYQFDPVSKTPYFTYLDGKQQRVVWYQDARGVAAHLPVLKRYGIKNTGLWALNFEDPGLWKELAQLKG
ncbi:glycosyl hydrolase family 18 protein [Streptomyces sp. 21So2-11]|uniref:glycosyl hydrolase family 18 protein n=1 Tax=Streptomyces sp. 21So2-11 TaxID=3144408 RepID=UPI003219AFD4